MWLPVRALLKGVKIVVKGKFWRPFVMMVVKNKKKGMIPFNNYVTCRSISF